MTNRCPYCGETATTAIHKCQMQLPTAPCPCCGEVYPEEEVVRVLPTPSPRRKYRQVEPCGECKGQKGRVVIQEQRLSGYCPWTPCPTCSGTGWVTVGDVWLEEVV